MSRKRYAIEWAPVAVADFEEMLHYIAAHDCVDAAMHVYEMIWCRVETLVMHSERGRRPPELKKLGVTEYRELIVAPYSVFYRICDKRVGIVAVLDRRRDLEELLVQRALRM